MLSSTETKMKTMSGNGKTALVIGGAGFVGSNLVHRLRSLGYYVVVVDDLSNGDLDNLEPFEDIKIIPLDISKLRHAEFILDQCDGNIDVIYHLACTALLPSFTQPDRDLEVNGVGMLTSIAIARVCGCPLIYTSSGSVYGITEPGVDESHATNPESPYGASKLIAEHYLRIFSKIDGFRACSLRLFNVYGPRQKISPKVGWIPVVPKFMHDVIDEAYSVIYGNGEQTRDFNFVDDVVDALILAGELEGLPQYFACNISSNEETSINDLYELIRLLFNQPGVEPIYKPAQPGELWRVRASNKKAKEILGWEPKTSVMKGLAKTKEYYEAKYGEKT